MGLTRIRAQQISDIDYKQACRAVATTNVTLSGGAAATVDGVSLQLLDRVLVTGQNTASENGFYFVETVGQGENGTWVRTTDANETGEIAPGMIVMVTEGEIYADTQWKLTTNGTVIVGTTDLNFVLNAVSVIGGSNTQIQYNAGGTLAGSANLTFANDELTVIGQANVSGNITTGNITANTGNFTTLSVTTGVSSNLVPTANVTYDLGTANLRWNQLFLAGNTIDLGGAIMKSDPVEGTIALIPRVRPGETATKAIVIGQQGIATVNTDVNGIVSAEDLQAAAINPNTTTTNLFVSSTASVTGNITGGNITISGKIQGTVSSGTITLTQPGNITSPFTGVSRFYPLANLVVNNVFASLGTTSSDQFLFRLNKNGSNVGLFAMDADSYRVSGVAANVAISTTDYLTLDIVSGTDATDLRVDLRYTLE
jgi:cytoskeletal protein CcmA (bactofilin family)